MEIINAKVPYTIICDLCSQGRLTYGKTGELTVSVMHEAGHALTVLRVCGRCYIRDPENILKELKERELFIFSRAVGIKLGNVNNWPEP